MESGLEGADGRRDDDFFDLGGTSLAAALLLFTVAEVFNRSVSIRESTQRPTVAMLADALVPV